MTWDEMIAQMQDYIDSLTNEDIKRIDKELNIREYVTVFGTIRYITYPIMERKEP